MTRLRSADIAKISAGLKAYDEELLSKTGKTLRGIACYAMELNEEDVVDRLSHVHIGVVPVDWGQGFAASARIRSAIAHRSVGPLCPAPIRNGGDRGTGYGRHSRH